MRQEETPQEDPRIRMMEELEQRRQDKAEKKLSGQLDIFMWFISAIYPFIGFVWCIMFMSQDNRDKRMQGVWILLAASIGLLIWYLLSKSFMLGKLVNLANL